MKKFTFIAITAMVIAVIAGVLSTKVTAATQQDARNYAYEAYCDSIYEADPDYYLDVLTETDEYQEYLEIHGEWWTK